MAAFAKTHVLALLIASALPFSGRAAAAENACLLSNTEFAKFTGGNPKAEPNLLIDTMCEYDNGEIQLYSGKDSQAQWNEMMQMARLGSAKKAPVSGIADNAYLLIPDPQGPIAAFVVFDKGEHTVVVAIRPPLGKSPESVRDQVIAAAKLVATKVK